MEIRYLLQRLLAVLCSTYGVRGGVDKLARTESENVFETMKDNLGHEPNDNLVAWRQFTDVWDDQGEIAPSLRAYQPAQLEASRELLESFPIEDRCALLAAQPESKGHMDFCVLAEYLNGTVLVATPTSPGSETRLVEIGDFEAAFWIPTSDENAIRPATCHAELPTLRQWVEALVRALESGDLLVDHRRTQLGLSYDKSTIGVQGGPLEVYPFRRAERPLK